MILTITLTCVAVAFLLFLLFICGCRKYKNLQTQYYERVNLLRTQPNNGAGGDRFSDPNGSLEGSGSSP